MFTKIYCFVPPQSGNRLEITVLNPDVLRRTRVNRFLLRSLLGKNPVAIPRRIFSSSLPPFFPSGRFAAFLFTPLRGLAT